MSNLRRILSLVLCVVMVLTIALPTALAGGLDPEYYTVRVIYDSDLAEFTLKNTDNGESLKNPATLNHYGNTAKVFNLAMEMPYLEDGWQIMNVTKNGEDCTDEVIEGDYGSFDFSVNRDTTIYVVLEPKPEEIELPPIQLYEDDEYTQKIVGSITADEDTVIYAGIDEGDHGIDVKEVFESCYYEYSLDGNNWKEITSWGDRSEFVPKDADGDIDFLNTKNYKLRAHAVGTFEGVMAEGYSNEIVINPTGGSGGGSGGTDFLSIRGNIVLPDGFVSDEDIVVDVFCHPLNSGHSYEFTIPAGEESVYYEITGIPAGTELEPVEFKLSSPFADGLYQRGYLNYDTGETEVYSPEINLVITQNKNYDLNIFPAYNIRGTVSFEDGAEADGEFTAGVRFSSDEFAKVSRFTVTDVTDSYDYEICVPKTVEDYSLYVYTSVPEEVQTNISTVQYHYNPSAERGISSKRATLTPEDFEDACDFVVPLGRKIPVNIFFDEGCVLDESEDYSSVQVVAKAVNTKYEYWDYLEITSISDAPYIANIDIPFDEEDTEFKIGTRFRAADGVSSNISEALNYYSQNGTTDLDGATVVGCGTPIDVIIPQKTSIPFEIRFEEGSYLIPQETEMPCIEIGVGEEGYGYSTQWIEVTDVSKPVKFFLDKNIQSGVDYNISLMFRSNGADTNISSDVVYFYSSDGLVFSEENAEAVTAGNDSACEVTFPKCAEIPVKLNLPDNAYANSDVSCFIRLCDNKNYRDYISEHILFSGDDTATIMLPYKEYDDFELYVYLEGKEKDTNLVLYRTYYIGEDFKLVDYSQKKDFTFEELKDGFEIDLPCADTVSGKIILPEGFVDNGEPKRATIYISSPDDDYGYEHYEIVEFKDGNYTYTFRKPSNLTGEYTVSIMPSNFGGNVVRKPYYYEKDGETALVDFSGGSVENIDFVFEAGDVISGKIVAPAEYIDSPEQYYFGVMVWNADRLSDGEFDINEAGEGDYSAWVESHVGENASGGVTGANNSTFDSEGNLIIPFSLVVSENTEVFIGLRGSLYDKSDMLYDGMAYYVDNTKTSLKASEAAVINSSDAEEIILMLQKALRFEFTVIRPVGVTDTGRMDVMVTNADNGEKAQDKLYLYSWENSTTNTFKTPASFADGSVYISYKYHDGYQPSGTCGGEIFINPDGTFSKDKETAQVWELSDVNKVSFTLATDSDFGTGEIVETGSCGDNLTYTLTDTGVLTISGTGDMSHFASESSVPWYSVRNKIKKVVIGNEVTSIGNWAFSNTAIKTITIPESVTSLGRNAFLKCTNLTGVSIPDSVTSIGAGVFRECSFLTDVTLPSGLKGIPDQMFYQCKSLTDISFLEGMTSIGTYAFAYCSNIGDLVIPEGMEMIGDSAFMSCTSLTKVTVPDTVYLIGSGALSGGGYNATTAIYGYSGGPAEIYARAGNHPFTSIGKSTLASKVVASGTFGENITWSLTGGGTLTITGSGKLESGGYDDAPWNYVKAIVKKVIVGENITSIGKYTFYGHGALTEVVLPETLEELGYYAFYSCSNLKSITIPDNITKIDDYAFTSYYLEKIYGYTGSVAQTYANDNNIAFESIGTSQSGDKVLASGDCGEDVQWTLTGNGTLTLSGSGAMDEYEYASQIGWNSYRDRILKVVVKDDITSLSAYAFCNLTAVKEVIIPDSIETIGKKAFYECQYLTKITIPSSVKRIEEETFSYCYGLLEVILPDGLEYIGRSAFGGCYDLKSVTIPDSVSEIGKYAFNKDTLKTIYGYPGSAAEIFAIENNISFVPLGQKNVIFTVCDGQDENLSPVSGANVLVRGEDGVTMTSKTNSEGKTQFNLTKGHWEVSVFADGYEMRNFIIDYVPDIVSKEYTVYIGKTNPVEVDITTKEMTLDEIIAAGIDPNAVENKQVYNCSAVLDFIPNVKLDYICADDEVISCEPVKSGNVTVEAVSKDLFLIVKSSVTWLKEMFEIQLVAKNTSYAEVMEAFCATLNIPEGVSLAKMAGSTQQSYSSASVNIAPQGTAQHSWYICGDAEGEYTLDGSMSYVRTYGDISTWETRRFSAKSPIVVLGGSAMKLLIEAERNATAGTPYKVRYTLTNESDKTLYNVALNVLGGKFFDEFGITEWKYAADFGEEGKEGLSGGFVIEDKEFEPDEKLSGVFEITFGEGVDLTATEYILKKMFVITGSGSTVTIPTEIRYMDDINSHDWDDGVITKDATCTESGIKTYTCTCGCGQTKTEEIPALGHDMGQWQFESGSSCEAGGTQRRHCSRCDYTETQSLAALGHDWETDYTVDAEATCTEAGSKSRHCTRCDEKTDVTVIAAKGHSMGSWKFESGSTCTTGGTQIRKCANCDYTETQSTSALGHSWETEYTIDVAPTCTEYGSKSRHCSRCSATKASASIAPTGHSMTEWEVVTNATCTDSGSKKRTCTVCGHSENATIPATDHDWDDGVVTKPATETETGKKVYTCKNGCGETWTETIPKLVKQEISVPLSEIVMTYGDKKEFYNTALNSSENGGVLSYFSSNEEVATVDETGKVTVHNSGETIISITAAATDYYTATTCTYKLIVKKAPLKISPVDISLYYGEEAIISEYNAEKFVFDEDKSVLEGNAEFSTDYEIYDGPGQYYVFVNGLTARNYEITFEKGILTVEKETAFAIVLENLAQSRGKVVPVKAEIVPKDDSAQIKVEYQLADGTWTEQVPVESGKYNVRAQLVASENIEVPAQTEYTEAILEIMPGAFFGSDENGDGIGVDTKRDENGNIEFIFDDETINKIIENVPQSGDVLLDSTEITDGSEDIILPNNIIDAMDESDKVKTFTIKAVDASVTVDKSTIGNLASQLGDGDTLSIRVDSVSKGKLNDEQKAALEAIDADAVVLQLNMIVNTVDENGNPYTKDIHALGGKATVTAKYSLPSAMQNKTILVCYIDNDGVVSYINATYKDGFVTFETNHFSYFAIAAAPCPHNWDNGNIIKEPTATEDGIKEYVCHICGMIKTETVPALGTGATVEISKVTTRAGEETDVILTISNNPGFVNLSLEVGYDSNVLTLVNATPNPNVGANFTPAQTYTKNPYNMSWNSTSNVTYNGDVAILTFKVKEGTPDGLYPITLDYYKGPEGNFTDGENVNFDENFKEIRFVYISGGVIVASYTPGDINGDGFVDNKDATTILRELAGWILTDVVEAALDVNGDGFVDNKDATVLLRYLAGWDVELH